tara:strand:+ start:2797 stop:3945 length:1149 start_codon:yes stop_codon:yes gene_type:complete
MTQNIDIIDSFDDMGLSDDLLRGIYSIGFENPSAIQQRAIVPLINGLDIIAQSQSGTGKTGTFSIGSLQVIDPDIKQPQVLILSPTRELAQQTYNVAKQLNKYLNYSIMTLIGGKNINHDFKQLDNGCQIIIGCPGRVFDMLKRFALKTDNLKLMIVDEADEMLSRGFKDQIYEILQYIPDQCKVGLFSATMPEEVLAITNKIMKDPLRILIKKEELTLEGIKQFYVYVNNEFIKYDVLCDIYSNLATSQTIIYCNSKRKSIWLNDKLTKEGFAVSLIYGDMHQSDRESIIKNFRNGSTRILISTDILARGIDIQQVSLVINYDVPKYRETYIHRIGRSGRYGRKGLAINFVNNDELSLMRDIESFYNTMLEELPKNFNELL